MFSSVLSGIANLNLYYIIEGLFKGTDFFKTVFFAISLMCLRYSVIGLMSLNRTGFKTMQQKRKFSFNNNSQLLGEALFITYSKGEKQEYSSRAPTWKNEETFVNRWRVLEIGGGDQYRHDELLEAFKTTVWIDLCVRAATYSFVFTVCSLPKTLHLEGCIVEPFKYLNALMISWVILHFGFVIWQFYKASDDYSRFT